MVCPEICENFSKENQKIPDGMTNEETAKSGPVKGIRVSGIKYVCGTNLNLGRQWKAPAKPNHNPALKSTFAKRIAKTKQVEATKALEKQLGEERKAAENVSPFLMI